MCVRGGGEALHKSHGERGAGGWGGGEGVGRGGQTPFTLLLSVYLHRNLEKHKLVTYLALLAVRGCMHVQTVQFPKGLFTFKQRLGSQWLG